FRKCGVKHNIAKTLFGMRTIHLDPFFCAIFPNLTISGKKRRSIAEDFREIAIPSESQLWISAFNILGGLKRKIEPQNINDISCLIRARFMASASNTPPFWMPTQRCYRGAFLDLPGIAKRWLQK
ncbi:MAG: hypothetical protein RSD95_16815, partial [Clostridia bacterium]